MFSFFGATAAAATTTFQCLYLSITSQVFVLFSFTHLMHLYVFPSSERIFSQFLLTIFHKNTQKCLCKLQSEELHLKVTTIASDCLVTVIGRSIIANFTLRNTTCTLK